MLKHFQTLERILSHPACEIIQQIHFDFHLIEVSGGRCFHIPSRKFVPCPIPESKHGLVSPRAFIPYQCSTPPDPGFFKDGILNSFPETKVRVNFLNKLYQCLFASQMPQKVRKLVVAGPKDSGKTSWASIFHRIIPPGYIASITNEQQFSASMITNDTQLVFVDEWSENTLQSDLAKTILQGGWMVSAVKHGPAKCIMNNSPYYITTNLVPDFGREDENVKRRIAVFTTTSLPKTLAGVDRWIFDHAMDCVVWMAEEITANHGMIDADELWYEGNSLPANIIDNNQGAKLYQSNRMQSVTNTDLQHAFRSTAVESNPIDESFEVEYTRRRLARKRRTARIQLESSSSDEECRDDEPLRPSDTVPAAPTVADDAHDDPKADHFEIEQHELWHSNNEAGQDLQHTANSSHMPCCSKSLVAEAMNDLEEDREVDVQPTINAATSESLHKEECERADENERSQRRQNTRSRLVLNTSIYFDKVAEVVSRTFLLSDLTHLNVRSFIERRKKAERRREVEERRFWSDADPTIDAWMLVIGEKRDVFDLDAYVVRHPDAHRYTERVRRMVKMQVLPCSCPVYKAVKRMVRGEPESEVDSDDVDSQGLPRRPRLSSQSYWTKMKSWRPW